MTSVVYKIFCKDPNIKDIYIGSTKNFRRRKNDHKTSCYNENCKSYNFVLYQFIRNHGGFDNFDFEILETLNNDSNARIIEQKYISERKPNLNQARAHITKEERNKEKQRYDREYVKSDKFKEYQKQYRKTEKRINTQKKYLKEYRKEYEKTEKYKEHRKKHNSSEKTKQSKKEHYERQKFIKIIMTIPLDFFN